MSRARRWLLVALLGTVVVAAAGGWITWRAWHSLDQPFQGYSGPETTVEVPPGMTAGAVLQRLESLGVLADARVARLYLVHVLGDPPVHAGEYRFRGPLTARRVLGMLVSGEVATHPLTVIEGLTLDETADSLARSGLGSREQFRREMDRVELIADLDPRATDLEGYLFPDTYHFARTATPAQVVETMTRQFRRQLESRVRPLLGTDSPDLRDLVTLASIVEKEASLDDERPLVASVYRNRLDRGIGLFADPTVIYALKRLGRWDGDIRREDLRLDHPYNTYVVAGLPPGPICSPGLASLSAAARPATSSYLYFVSRNDGSHVFARTLDEHNRNVRRWQIDYWRERRGHETAAADDSDAGETP